MRQGERRVLEIPAEEAYGGAGFPEWGIPPHAPLVFDLECLRIKN